MKQITLSMDRIVVEYTKIRPEFFSKYVGVILCDYYHTYVHPNNSKGYHYTCYIQENNQYLHIKYKPIRDGKQRSYSLILETRPESMEHFTHIFKAFSRDINTIINM